MAEYAPKVTCVAKVHERVSASLLWSAWTASKMDTKDLVCSHADARTLELTGVGLISLDGVTTTVEIDNADVTFIAARSCKTRNTTNQNSNVAVSTCDRYTVSVKQRSPATAAIAPTVATKHPGKTASQSQIT